MLSLNYRNDLLYHIKLTRSSRFDAARRMKLAQSTSTFAVAFCTIYSIVLSIMSFKIKSGISFWFIHCSTSAYCSFCAVVMDVFVLVISLLSIISGYENQSRIYHDCALELGELERRIEMIDIFSVNEDMFKDFTSTYNQILSKYRNNHSVIDYLHASLYVGVSNYHECCICSEKNKRWIAFRYHILGMHTFYILCMILPILLFFPVF